MSGMCGDDCGCDGAARAGRRGMRTRKYAIFHQVGPPAVTRVAQADKRQEGQLGDMTDHTKTPDPVALLVKIRAAKRELVQAMEQLCSDERWAVAQARSMRRTWGEIADATGAPNGNAARAHQARRTNAGRA